METCNSATPIFLRTAGKFLTFRYFSRCRLLIQVFSLESSWIFLDFTARLELRQSTGFDRIRRQALAVLN